MKYYLLVLLFVIFGVGAHTMFKAAYYGMAVEHEFAPTADTSYYMIFSAWFVVLMVADIILLRNRQMKGHIALTILLSVGVFGPIIFLLLK